MNDLCMLRSATIEAVSHCKDAGMLDLVFKLLLSCDNGRPDEPCVMEVNQIDNHQGNPQKHRNVSAEVLRSSAHPETYIGGLGKGNKQLSHVRRGTNRVSRAA